VNAGLADDEGASLGSLVVDELGRREGRRPQLVFSYIDAQLGQALLKLAGGEEGIVGEDEKVALLLAETINELVGAGDHVTIADEHAIHVAQPTHRARHSSHLSSMNEFTS
jgi:hypothetical protein